jgi:ribose transport system substrate-binding protein
MKIAQILCHRVSVSALFAAGALIGATNVAVSQEVVAGPGAEPECFAPWAAETTFLQYPAQEGPFRIALANGYIANSWRIQMIQTAKAYAAQPEVAAKLAEFKVVSTGEDVAAQISAINNFIDSGYQAIVVNAQNPTERSGHSLGQLADQQCARWRQGSGSARRGGYFG